MNNKKIIIYVLIAVLVLWLIWKNVKGNRAYTLPATSANSTNLTNSVTTQSSNVGTSSNGSSCTNETTLKKGMNCDRVQWSQYKINQVASQLGISKLTQDSKFGAKTEQAFQKLLGKKTGSWNEVLSKCNQLLHQAVATPVEGTTINDSIKW